jgi:hypothetical protein
MVKPKNLHQILTGVDGSFSSCFSSVFSSEFIDSCDSAISESCEISGEFDVDFLVSPFLLFQMRKQMKNKKKKNHPLQLTLQHHLQMILYDLNVGNC